MFPETVILQFPDALRCQVRQADRLRCACCQAGEQIGGIPLTMAHILPVSKGGARNLTGLQDL